MSTTTATGEGIVPIVEMTGISKGFGGVQALTNASLAVLPGEVHALLGENGAGKSTLVKILAGAHLPDAGEVRWHGEPVAIRSFSDAERLGIRVIYQQLNVLDHLTVAENISLARERSRFSFVDLREERRRAVISLDRLGVSLNPDTPAGELRVAEKQLVEIARALWGETRLLVMDEPTASLGDREVDHLFETIGHLRSQGIAIIYISHKLDEVYRIADRITVLRNGSSVGTVYAAETDQNDLISMMVGRSLGHRFRSESHARDTVRLDVESLSTETGLRDVSFRLRAGEVLGVYGLLGSGRTELARALFGADPTLSGSISVEGNPVHFRSPAEAKRAGIGLVTEERAEALFPLLSVRENLTSASSDLFAPGGLVRRGRERELARSMTSALRIRTPSYNAAINGLSGGNQQKAIVGRWLMRDVKVLILDDPTSGIDVGAKDELYGLLDEMTKRGTSVIMTSSELPELMALSDRMLVLHWGRLVGILSGPELTEENVIRLAVTGQVGDAIAPAPAR